MGIDTPKWLRDEWQKVSERRERAFSTAEKLTDDVDQESGPRTPEPKNLFGLTLSGGGIRSALFNDGFLQGLSHCGLLRYVDYLCSVSGGGYIAGHLISQAKDPTDTQRKAFHDDPVRYELGRDPTTGKVDSRRLAGIGGYLSRTSEFLPAYLWSFLFSFAFYIGMVGFIATLAALFWRSFDDPIFRLMHSDVLGLTMGGELLIAFIPAILLVVLYVFGEALLSGTRLLFGFDRPLLRTMHLVTRKVLLICIILALMTSVAVFLGNGKTSVRSGASSTLYLNHYAQYLAIACGVIQVLVFMGRDRLFRSERSEAKQWQKYVQQTVTTFVLLCLTFSMVHWMAREDISHFTHNRDPYLVQGDVTDWHVMEQLYAKVVPKDGGPNPEPSGNLYPTDNLPEHVKPSSRWIESIATGRLGIFGLDPLSEDDLSKPPSPLQLRSEPAEVWSLPRRAYANAIGYALAMGYLKSDSGTLALKNYQNLVNELAKPANTESVASGSDPIPPAEVQPTLSTVEEYIKTLPQRTTLDLMRKAFFEVERSRVDQVVQLKKWNTLLETQELTQALLNGMGGKDASGAKVEPTGFALVLNKVMQQLASLGVDVSGWKSTPIDFVALSDRVTEMLDAKVIEITSSQRNQLLSAARLLNFTDPPSRDLPREKLSIASVNRLLLEALFPGAVQQYEVPSTLVVPFHDQQSRRRWLLFWTSLTLLGLIGGLGPYRIATVFQFYREQLGSNFLVATHDPSRRSCDKELRFLNPTADGLPYPLMLAATMEPSTCNGSYRVESRPFVFSPMYCGRFEEGSEPIPSQQLSFSLNPDKRGVTLGDAITLSGAAVTPLMSNNRWLSLILDFFNSGIGQRIRRVDRTSKGGKEQDTGRPIIPVVFSSLSFGLVLLAAKYVVGLGWWPSVFVAFTMLLLEYCVVMRVGSPGLIRSLVLPRKGEGHDQAEPTPEDHRSFYVADGGYTDYLGVSELLRRRCELIVVSDAGANIGDDALGTLARMCENAAHEMGIRFLDLDHEAPIDFGRLELTDQRLVHQPYLCMRIRYPESDRKEGLLFYCQMSITKTDPIEIQHIRNLFPSFPDEPTVNQFYSDKQVTAYRTLGYHIANRLCNELQRWQDGSDPIEQEIPGSDTSPLPKYRSKSQRFRHSLLNGRSAANYDDAAKSKQNGQPLFRVLKERLLTAYRLACYEELSYSKDDIFSEAVWPTAIFAFPTFRAVVTGTMSRIDRDLPDRWLREYERSADVRSAYRTAVIGDINTLDIGSDCLCEVLWSAIIGMLNHPSDTQRRYLLAAHMTNIGTACQEVHRGRPHSTFQVGGREKMLELCRSVAEVISESLEQEAKASRENLLAALDQVIMELIELERSVFQGGEHVTTISFAQCVSTMSGRIARQRKGEDDPDEVELDGMRQTFSGTSVDAVEQPNEQLASPKSPELSAAEIRRDLDMGLKKMRLRLAREALAKAWYLGYFKRDEITAASDFPPDADGASGAASKAAGAPQKKAGQSKRKPHVK